MRYAAYDDGFMHRQFMPRIAVPDHELWLAREAALSAAARARFKNARFDIAYGDTPGQRLDVFPAERPDAPIFAFYHGGYWRALDKSNYAFLATPLVPAGATTVLVNYDLCPTASLDEIVRQTMRSIAWLHRNAAIFGGDPNRIHIGGNSAGAHLAAMALAHDWRADGLPTDFIKGACCITGIYDAEPVLRIPANDDIRLTADMVARNSPLFLTPVVRAPVIVAVGGDEPSQWIAQSTAYAAMLRRHGHAVEEIVAAGKHHFSITHAMASADDPIIRAILLQMGLR